MQKFGLDTVLEKTKKLDDFEELEFEILKETSSALGRAGRKLRESIESHKEGMKSGFKDKAEIEHLQEIGNDFHALMIQRELIGFIESNVNWIQKFYEIPEGAYKFLGIYKSK